MDLLIVGLVALAVAAAALGAVVATRRWDDKDGALQQQLGELRSRLDALVEAQRDVPRALAEGSAIQARSLADVRERLVQVTEATKRLEHVGGAVSELHDLLHAPKLRGTTGERLLAELLHQALPESAYELEYAFRSGERVDAVIRLRDRLVPVDAKFPLEAFRRMGTVDGDAAERERRAFHRSLRGRVDEIADKYIRPDEGTSDFALMYLPAESLYYEAVVHAPRDGERESLAEYALRRKVHPVSPHTFYAYLSAVAQGLRGAEVERNARAILDRLGMLDRELLHLEETLGVAGRHLGNATRQYDDAMGQVGSLRKRLLDVSGEQ